MAEPYGHWQGLARGSRQYQELKTQRAELLWGLIDQVGCLQLPALGWCVYLSYIGIMAFLSHTCHAALFSPYVAM